VALLSGGLSAERDVSNATSDAIERALRGVGYDVVRVDAGHDLPAKLSAIGAEVVFVGLHGTYGEDGRLQGLLDWMAIPYTGAGMLSSAVAFDKVASKRAYRAAGVPVAADVVFASDAASSADVADLPFGLPAVVKPSGNGSSVGVTRVHAAEALRAALAEAASFGGDVLVEQLVEGPEVSVVCVDDTCVGSVEIEPAREFYDYEAKYGSTGTRYHVPPRLDASTRQAVESAGLAAHRALGCRGVTRSDVILGAAGPVVLETNTLPGMTASSLVPKVAAADGVSFEALVEAILDRAACGPEGL
jgi:D-alanine-D-alanine ligase